MAARSRGGLGGERVGLVVVCRLARRARCMRVCGERASAPRAVCARARLSRARAAAARAMSARALCTRRRAARLWWRARARRARCAQCGSPWNVDWGGGFPGCSCDDRLSFMKHRLTYLADVRLASPRSRLGDPIAAAAAAGAGSIWLPAPPPALRGSPLTPLCLAFSPNGEIRDSRSTGRPINCPPRAQGGAA